MWITFSLIYVYLLVFMVWSMHSTATFNAWDSILQDTTTRINKYLNDYNLDAISLEWQAYDMYKQSVWKI